MEIMFENCCIITDKLYLMFILNVKMKNIEYHKSAWVSMDLSLNILK